MKPVAAWNLTPREVEVLDCLVELGCQKLIARRLCLSVRTVEIHMANIYEKTGAPRGGAGGRVLVAVAWARHRLEAA